MTTRRLRSRLTDRFEWLLLAESGPQISKISGYLNVRFGEKRTIRGGEGAKMAGLSYRRRMRVGSVGTVQSRPPLPELKAKGLLR